MKQLLPYLLLSIFIFSCTKASKNPPNGLITENAMVVSAREEASKIGVDILKKGGNAFDAMMATEMALAVTFPYAGNLGGGGFMVYRLNNGETGALDFREKAPLAASSDMYLDSLGNVIPNKSTVGPFAVGVPGTIAGLFAAHEKFGSLPVKDILVPVIELAKKGFKVTKYQEERFDTYDSIFKAVNGKDILFSSSIKAGDTIKNISIANTLERIAQNGKKEFYEGQTAQHLVNFIQEKGGIITMEDLALYEAKWRDPITFQYKDLQITSMSPPSSGGICLGQILKMVEPFDLKSYGHNSLKTIQVLVEAERRAYADRSFYLGDPDFVDIPTETLLDTDYLKERMANFSFETPTKSEALSYGSIVGFGSNETTHYSIVDAFGNAVSVTTTLNGAYGSKLYVDELGFFLNNEMDDFSSKPGVPNSYGLLGAEANSISPQKRMLSAMTPTIIEKNGKLFMVLGTPGGSTIITSVLQTILNVEEFGMGMQEAVDAPRFHHQWLPDEIRMEVNLFPETLKNQLKGQGYPINETAPPISARVDAILVLDNGTLEGGADHRGDDTAAGY
ncbi:gamma-glutamyltransferase [Mangrovimonas sp. DI 80]|uniref:gamma-glutamyltransferase n=1 Tax=Mangrovimonas sp. DI 80 TaxID=1779330 RepID=UPI0009755C7D|nr:gamma-glutamyltransferase [Mangrovimonas sp. DI 80]OMP30085.1 gamma-glutamyltransferase [Mangrovimonas sp. DI 80]